MKKSCANCYWQEKEDGRCQVCDVGYPFWHKKNMTKTETMRQGILKAIEYGDKGGNRKTLLAMLNNILREVKP